MHRVALLVLLLVGCPDHNTVIDGGGVDGSASGCDDASAWNFEEVTPTTCAGSCLLDGVRHGIGCDGTVCSYQACAGDSCTSFEFCDVTATDVTGACVQAISCFQESW